MPSGQLTHAGAAPGSAGELRVVAMRAGSLLCAVPAASVVETLRPLALEPLENAPRFVLGVSIIRGEPIPVVDLRALLDGIPGGDGRRLIVLRVGERRVALRVDAVVGVQSLEPARFREFPPVLGGAASGVVDALAVADEQLVLLLRAVRLLPDLPSARAGEP